MSKRKKTRFPGVQQRESDSKRYNGRPDICFTIDYMDNGKRIRKNIGWASEGFTAAVASGIRLKLINEAKTKEALGYATPTSIPTFKEAWTKYRTDWLIAQGKDTSHPDSMIRTYLAPFMDMPLNKINAYAIDRLMAQMREKGLSDQTIKHAVGLIKRIIKRIEVWGFYNGPTPFNKIIMPKPNNTRERFLNTNEARELLQALAKRSQTVWLMALLSLLCGLRFGEIARLKWEDIKWEENTIFIAKSKNGCSRYADMGDTIKNALMEIKDFEGLIFPDTNGHVRKEAPKIFFKVVKEIGLNGPPEARITDPRQRVCFHTLRHTYASWLAKSGQGQLVIADRLGHHSLEMTKRYTHLMDATRKESAIAIDRMFHSENPENQS